MPTYLELSRRNAGLTQGQLAAASGVSRATISAIERGYRDPARSTLEQLSRALLEAADGTALTWPADALVHHSSLTTVTWLPQQMRPARSPAVS